MRRRNSTVYSLGFLALAALLALIVAMGYRFSDRVLHFLLGSPASQLVVAKTVLQPTFPLRVEPGKRYLIDANGKPFLMHGDTAWSLIADLTREEADVYFADRKARGFNTLLVNLLEHRFSRNAPANIYGEAPFTEAGNFATPNEAYFKHADWVLGRARDLGFLVLLAPAYIGHRGTDEGWWKEMTSHGAQAIRAYGRFLSDRYSAFNNIIWVNGGDDDPADKSLVEIIAENFKQAAPEQLQTAHNAPDSIVPGFWKDASWLDLTSVYTYEPVCEKVAAAYQYPLRRPAFLIESAYENEHHAKAHRIRGQAYQALLCGAAGEIFGNNPMWHFAGPGLYDAPTDWWNALGSDGAQSMTHLVNLFSRLPWWTLIPDLDGRMIKAGRGEGADLATLSASDDGHLAVAYLPSRRTLNIDLTQLAGKTVVAQWFDPANGETIDVQNPTRTKGQSSFAAPGKNSAGDGDWVLILRSVD